MMLEKSLEYIDTLFQIAACFTPIYMDTGDVVHEKRDEGSALALNKLNRIMEDELRENKEMTRVERVSFLYHDWNWSNTEIIEEKKSYFMDYIKEKYKKESFLKGCE